ncbi:MAG: hypothetical protein WC959_08445 [Kiritimatiellales bacterium]
MAKKIPVLIALCCCVSASFSEIIVKENFNYPDGTKLEQISGWVDDGGETGRGVVSGGMLRATGKKMSFLYSLSQSYAVSSGTKAGKTVPELWFRFSVCFSDGGFRAGMTSSSYQGNLHTYAVAQIRNQTGNITQFRSNINEKIVDAQDFSKLDGSHFLHIYGRISDDRGELKLELWYNPADLENPGTPDIVNYRAYRNSKIIDRIAIDGWALSMLKLDSFYVGTTVTDVAVEKDPELAAGPLLMITSKPAGEDILRELPVFSPAASADSRINEWLFQPGTAIKTPPEKSGWEAVNIPFSWTKAYTSLPASSLYRKDKDLLSNTDSSWFERRIYIPPEWDGQRILLEFDGIECDAVLFIDKKEPVFIEGPEARVNITSLVTPGKEATLRLWVTRWWQDIPKMRKDDILRDAVLSERAKSAGGEEAQRKLIPGGLSGFVRLVSRPSAGEVTAAFVKTSVREKRMAIDIEARNDLKNAQFKIEIENPGGEGGSVPAPVIVPAEFSGTGLQTVSIPWEAPRLWMVDDGYLYQLKISLLNNVGETVHTLPEKFGFREIWTEGKQLILNGYPLRLRLAPEFSPQWPRLLFWKSIGYNAIEWQPNRTGWYAAWGLRPTLIDKENNPQISKHWVDPAVFDKADECGFALLIQVPGVSHIRDAVMTPEGTKKYQRDLALWLRRLRNHPSILLWTPSMNTASITRENPEKIGRKLDDSEIPAWAPYVENLVRTEDPTRLVFHHSGRGGDIDYPNNYLNFMPLQEREDFPSGWAENGNMPWGAIEHGQPAFLNLNRWRNTPLNTEYYAIYFGDKAYAMETDDYVRLSQTVLERERDRKGRLNYSDAEYEQFGNMTAHWEWEKLFNIRTDRAWRTYGVPGGWVPWMHKIGFGTLPGNRSWLDITEPEAQSALNAIPEWTNPMYSIYRSTMRPLLIYLGGEPGQFTECSHAFFSGETFEKTMIAVWDGFSPRTLDVSWTLNSGGAAGGSDAFQLELSPGEIKKIPLRIRAPDVETRMDAELILVARDAKTGEEWNDRLELSFRPLPEKIQPQSSWAIYDPAGKSAGWLQQLGLENAAVLAKPADWKKAGAQVLVLGREAVSGAQLPFTAADIAAGLRVLILEQNRDALDGFRFRTEDIVTRYTFICDSAHPVFNEISAADLINWRGTPDLLPSMHEGMRPRSYPRPPHWGNSGAVASVIIETPHTGSFTPLADAEFDLAYSPLLEWRHGAGGILFSQFDFTDRINDDAAATALAANLIKAVDQPFASPQNRRIVFTGDDTGWNFIQTLGLNAVKISGELNPSTDILVVGTGAWKTNSGAAENFANAGGTVFVLPQTPADFAGAFTMETGSFARAGFAGDELLRGIGPAHCTWRVFLEQHRFAGNELPENSRRLLDGVMLEKKTTAGKIIFSQLDWRALDPEIWHTEKALWNITKFYRQLLTNLGAASSEQLIAGMFSMERFAPAPLVNITDWQACVEHQTDSIGEKDGLFPGLAGIKPPEAVNKISSGSTGVQRSGVTIGEGEADLHGQDFSGINGWTLLNARPNGRIYLEWISGAKTGRVGYARAWLYSGAARDAVFATGADRGMVFRVNEKAVLDNSKIRRPAGASGPGETRFKAPLKKGWNLLEVFVSSDVKTFGFWCSVSDPGDAVWQPSLSSPDSAPLSAQRSSSLVEPPVELQELLYIRPYRMDDDPYGFHPW